MDLDRIKIGTVSSVNPAKATARVVFPDDDGLVSYDLQVMQVNGFRNKDYAMPDVGTDVVCVFLGSGTEEGFIIGAVYTDGNPPPESSMDKRTVVFKDGTRVSYDRATHTLSAEIEGTSIVADRQNVTITAPKSVTINCTTATVNASASVTLDTPKTDITGVLNVTGLITGKGGLTVSGGGGGASIQCSGNMNLNGTIAATGDVTAGGISLQGHTHTGVHGETSAAN